MKLRRFWPYLVLALVVAANGLVFVYRVLIMDWLQLRAYDAPTAVASLVRDTTMTPYAKRLFYVNRPAIEDKQSFNQHCADHLEHSAVLGCYHGDRRGIYLYNVTDQRLHGVEQVTAAHEMLHQAYDRLDSKEKMRVRDLLQKFYDTQLTDKSIREKIDLYRQANTVDLLNEMHSIFGTEVAKLSPDLESYYSRYFTGRGMIVEYSQQYRAEFEKLQQQVEAYDRQLSVLEKQIESNKSQLSADLGVIQSMERGLRTGPQGGSIDAYNNEVRNYNSLINNYNSTVERTRALIDEYNGIVASRNTIAFAERQLQEALDSRLAPVTR